MLSYPKGQIFTAGKSGPLSRVSLGIIKDMVPTQITASIYASDGNGAIGSALATKTVLASAVPSYSGCNPASPTSLVNFDFSTPASVVSGSRYIIVMTTPDSAMPPFSNGLFGWNQASGPTSGAVNSPLSSPTANAFSYVFQTYVDI
jgi:hypothetical protein